MQSAKVFGLNVAFKQSLLNRLKLNGRQLARQFYSSIQLATEQRQVRLVIVAHLIPPIKETSDGFIPRLKSFTVSKKSPSSQLNTIIEPNELTGDS